MPRRMGLMSNIPSVLTLLICATGLQGAELTLSEAEAIAVREDPKLKGLSEKSLSLREGAVADGQLPDPKLRLGLLNCGCSFEHTESVQHAIDSGTLIIDQCPVTDCNRHLSALAAEHDTFSQVLARNIDSIPVHGHDAHRFELRIGFDLRGEETAPAKRL